MGTSFGARTIVGTPLSKLGTIEKESLTLETYTKYGEKTNENEIVTSAYFVMYNGNRHFLGSDENASRWNKGRISWDFDELPLEKFEDKWGENNRIWRSYYGGGPDTIIIGLMVGHTDLFTEIELVDLVPQIEQIQKELHEIFGYAGPIYIITQLYWG